MQELLSYEPAVAALDPQENELLYGRAGYLYALLYAQHAISNASGGGTSAQLAAAAGRIAVQIVETGTETILACFACSTVNCMMCCGQVYEELHPRMALHVSFHQSRSAAWGTLPQERCTLLSWGALSERWYPLAAWKLPADAHLVHLY